MNQIVLPSFTSTVCDAPDGEILPAAPPWVMDLMKNCSEPPSFRLQDGVGLRILRSADFTLYTTFIKNAADQDASLFVKKSQEAYELITVPIRQSADSHLCRMWNFIPGILKKMGPEANRYMVFNEGRYRAYRDLFGPDETFARQMPTATGVGHYGKDLVIHALASRQAGIPVENPRQVSAYHYSHQYGKLPPCFARATLLPRGNQSSMILVGGTASVRGEQTAHVGNLQGQINETYLNMATLVQSVWDKWGKTPVAKDVNNYHWLGYFRELRVYFMQADHVSAITGRTNQLFHSLNRMELMQADLCRGDLLVEIEGVADGPVVNS